MSGDDFSSIRARAGLTLAELGELLRVADLRTLRRWEDGDKPVSGPVSLLMELLDAGVIGPRSVSRR